MVSTNVDICYLFRILYIHSGSRLRISINIEILILECDWEGVYGRVAIDEGSDVGSFYGKSLSDCKGLCVEESDCWSIAFYPSQVPLFINCYLKDKILTKDSSFVSKDDWTTYYCTNDGETIKSFENYINLYYSEY